MNQMVVLGCSPLINMKTNRGEQTATALENDLTKLESKLDEILASLGVNIDDLEEGEDSTNADKKSNGEVDGKK